LVYQNRVQTADNLIREKWKGDSKCSLCLGVESVDHLIFECPLAGFVWSVIKEGMGWGRTLKSVKEFNDEFLLKRGGIKIMGFYFSCLGRCGGLYGLIGTIWFLEIS
jgi:hypothetical protein